jgi:hypothetical protein
MEVLALSYQRPPVAMSNGVQQASLAISIHILITFFAQYTMLYQRGSGRDHRYT